MLKKRLGIEGVERVWYSHEKLINYFKIPSTLVIPEGCMRIGECAFWECEGVKEVIIPEGCEKIEEYAFAWCLNLKKVVIPKSVEYIGYRAFGGCKEATIILKKPKFVFWHIGSFAFWECKDVKEEVRS